MNATNDTRERIGCALCGQYSGIDLTADELLHRGGVTCLDRARCEQNQRWRRADRQRIIDQIIADGKTPSRLA